MHFSGRKKPFRQFLATVNLRRIYLYLSKQWHVESQPVNPGVQWQVNPFTWSSHVPPCWHGLLAHSLTPVTQLAPVNDIEELHRKTAHSLSKVV